jgi:hypothetical protein
VGVRRVSCPAVVDVGELRGAARDDISKQARDEPDLLETATSVE